MSSYYAASQTSHIIVDAHNEADARVMAAARLDGPVVEFRQATDEEVALWDYHNEMTAGQAALEYRPGLPNRVSFAQSAKTYANSLRRVKTGAS